MVVVGVDAEDSKAIKLKKLPVSSVITEASSCSKIRKALVIVNKSIHYSYKRTTALKINIC